MLNLEEQDLLTRVGPGTSGGDLLRRYWHPIALAAQLESDPNPIPVKVMGESLVLFRDDLGRLALLGLHCPHRGTDLSYGRLEDGGIRCIYHGWLFDLDGNCLDQPGEPSVSTFKDKVKQISYPVREQGNLIFAYLGPGEPPLLPAYEALLVPPEYRFVWKHYQSCNYLQANEGNIDPVHLSYLHRVNLGEYDDDHSKFLQEGVGGDIAPSLEVEETDFGLRIFTVRGAPKEQNYLRITHFIMPSLCAVAGFTGDDGYLINWHVPIDDHSHWKFFIVFRRTAPLDHQGLESMWEREFPSATYLPKRTRENRYLQNRDEMSTGSFAGMGSFIPNHDIVATESSGHIQNRSEEHLGTTDVPVIQARRMMVKAISAVLEGVDPPHVVRSTSENQFGHIAVVDKLIDRDQDWKSYWKVAQVEHQQASPVGAIGQDRNHLE